MTDSPSPRADAGRPRGLRGAALLAAAAPLAAAALATAPVTAAVLTGAAPATLHTAALLSIGDHKTAVHFAALNNKYPDKGGD